LRFSEVFGLLFSGNFGFYYIEIHIRIHFHFTNCFSECWREAPTAASGPLSDTFSTLAKTSIYATGLQLNFPE